MKKRRITFTALGAILVAAIAVSTALISSTGREISESKSPSNTFSSDDFETSTAPTLALDVPIQVSVMTTATTAAPPPNSVKIDNTTVPRKTDTIKTSTDITTTDTPPETTKPAAEKPAIEQSCFTTPPSGPPAPNTETDAYPITEATTYVSPDAPPMPNDGQDYIWIEGFGWIVDHHCEVIWDTVDSDGDINKIVGIM